MAVLQRPSLDSAPAEAAGDTERIPLVKAVVRSSSLREAQELATLALTLHSEVEIAALVRSRLGDRFAAELEGSPAAALPA